jgi:hypothetical protein
MCATLWLLEGQRGRNINPKIDICLLQAIWKLVHSVVFVDCFLTYLTHPHGS